MNDRKFGVGMDELKEKANGNITDEPEKASVSDPQEDDRGWYVMQVMNGHEHKVIKMLATIADMPAQDECFVPKIERKKRLRGRWTKVMEKMYPGYVFVISNDILKIYYGAKEIPDLTKLIKEGDGFARLKPHEEEFLKKIQNKDHITEISKGYKEGDSVVVTEGPLMEYAGKIKYINRHKQYAVIEIEMFGVKSDLRIGLEVLSKPEELNENN